ncbi:hypothetical protein C8F04DRAFT_1193409 [Mycena alexandri]|uniref:Uncharacterized protein n=1 Tax=Mycena alexandri TaxID=1745969 RepID=A0AAD6SAT6_9AGAR|nr:hypothetical protein C8F04DRAFT_1193409 [Mycena alexandri]
MEQPEIEFDQTNGKQDNFKSSGSQKYSQPKCPQDRDKQNNQLLCAARDGVPAPAYSTTGPVSTCRPAVPAPAYGTTGPGSTCRSAIPRDFTATRRVGVGKGGGSSGGDKLVQGDSGEMSALSLGANWFGSVEDVAEGLGGAAVGGSRGGGGGHACFDQVFTNSGKIDVRDGR